MNVRGYAARVFSVTDVVVEIQPPRESDPA
jgi:hypothetical protein